MNRSVAGISIGAPPPPAPPPSVRAVRNIPRQTPEVPAGTERVKTRRVVENHWIVSRQDRERYLEDPARPVREVALKPEPGEEQDAVAGLTIVRISDQSPVHAAGFRRNDEIVLVNGTPIGDMNRATRLLHEIWDGDELTVRIRRGNELIDYRFDFR